MRQMQQLLPLIPLWPVLVFIVVFARAVRIKGIREIGVVGKEALGSRTLWSVKEHWEEIRAVECSEDRSSIIVARQVAPDRY